VSEQSDHAERDIRCFWTLTFSSKTRIFRYRGLRGGVVRPFLVHRLFELYTCSLSPCNFGARESALALTLAVGAQSPSLSLTTPTQLQLSSTSGTNNEQVRTTWPPVSLALTSARLALAPRPLSAKVRSPQPRRKSRTR
jgi:hypothetical protein